MTEQPPRKRIIQTIIFLFGLLILAIVANAIYITYRANRDALAHARKDAEAKLNIVESIHNNQIEKLKVLSNIVKEQNQKYCDFLDYDNLDALTYMLKALVNIYDIDLALLFNEYGEVLTTYPKGRALSDPSIYKPIITENRERVGVETISGAVIDEQFPKIGDGFKDQSNICFKSVIPLLHDIGDIYGHVIIVKFISGNTILVEQMSRIAEVEIVYYDANRKATLTSLAGTNIPFPRNGTLDLNSESYFTSMVNVEDYNEDVIGHLTVALNNQFFLRQRKQLLFTTLLPFVVSAIISIAIFIFLKNRVFEKINQLSNALRRVTRGEGDFSIRLNNPICESKRLHPDEVEHMCIDFNGMMDKLEETYNQMLSARREIETTNRELEERVNSRTTQLSEMYRDLEMEIEERRRTEKERLRLEHQLQRAQKMEAIGTLAGGVAHDLNNILSGIVSYPELILMNLAEDSPLKRPILTIKKSGEKAAAIVHDLLTLARRSVFEPKVVGLNRIISEYLSSPEFEKLIKYHTDIKVETQLAGDLLNISGSPIHLLKTVMNLVTNAIEATSNGGNILIATENTYVDKPFAGYDDVQEGDYVRLTVSDTGTGIASEDIERIFDPFFTRKQIGKSGTGLGMTVVWASVKDHQGYIDVQSAQGKGTSFILYFPATRELAAEEKLSFQIDSYKGNGERILVVDDIQEQREIATGMLKQLEYRVRSVASGEEAVEYLKHSSADILLLDMIMDPGIDGLETYKRIVEIKPGQKAIITSGFAESERVGETQKLGAGPYLKKPYTFEQIGKTIREELHQS
jgi:signal transduction histidine kinase/CheY-like chemotaxis protein